MNKIPSTSSVHAHGLFHRARSGARQKHRIRCTVQSIQYRHSFWIKTDAFDNARGSSNHLHGIGRRNCRVRRTPAGRWRRYRGRSRWPTEDYYRRTKDAGRRPQMGTLATHTAADRLRCVSSVRQLHVRHDRNRGGRYRHRHGDHVPSHVTRSRCGGWNDASRQSRRIPRSSTGNQP